MPNVLTTNSTVLCGPKDPTTGAHGGTGQVQSTAKLTVGGAPVLLLGSITSAVFPLGACGTPANPNQGNKPCTKVSSVTAGSATKLTVGGSNAVVLDTTLKGLTDGTVGGLPQDKLTAAAKQTKLSSV